MKQDQIRNFSIIAHIDHGKSTLADRILEITGAVAKRDMTEQILDSMDIERERGITIKAQTARLSYRADNGHLYQLNLIDTPGHVDFTYEVSRSLAACEGAVLVVDASQGVEAQTIANTYLAVEQDLVIIPVINKIDLPSADPGRVREELKSVLGIDPEDVLEVSAKAGTGVPALLEAIVNRVPPPKGDPSGLTRALIMDSWYDNYVGVVSLLRVFDGILRPKDEIRLMVQGGVHDVGELGVFTPAAVAVQRLSAGEVGYLVTGLKDIKVMQVGDTVTQQSRPATAVLPGFRAVRPMVFAGLYPAVSEDFSALREALERLQLNDSSLAYEPETSEALGFGFRCGFLGMLHMEVVQERLERHFELDLVTTAPTVVYRVKKTDGGWSDVDNPARLPGAGDIAEIHEPYVRATIMVPDNYLGGILALLTERRGEQKAMNYLEGRRVILEYDLPLAEVIFDFYDRLKSISKGYASFDYDPEGYRPGDLVKLDLRVNGEAVDALSIIVPREKAYYRGRELAGKMRGLIPRQMFEVVIQASIGNRVIAREVVRALRKNVLAKCYGGDVTRKRKLLEKQKEGKKRMKNVGKVQIPQDAFMAVLKVDN
ncbi:MAG TPA: elongation factor 4 [Proteobacteria bacterium]|nr:elongation factor 4 [Pseudomonadota bacterium]